MAKASKSSGWLINLCAFVAVILIGLSLIFAKIIPSISSAFSTIAQVISYVVVSVVSFFYIVRKKNVWLWVVWVVSIVLIVVGVVLVLV